MGMNGPVSQIEESLSPNWDVGYRLSVNPAT